MFTYILLYFACFPYHNKQLNSYCAVPCTLVKSQKWVLGLPLFRMYCRPSEVRTPSELLIEFSQLVCKPLPGVSFPVHTTRRVHAVCLFSACDSMMLGPSLTTIFLDIVAVPKLVR